jgi:hypothetical protein
VEHVSHRVCVSRRQYMAKKESAMIGRQRRTTDSGAGSSIAKLGPGPSSYVGQKMAPRFHVWLLTLLYRYPNVLYLCRGYHQYGAHLQR